MKKKFLITTSIIALLYSVNVKAQSDSMKQILIPIFLKEV